MKPFSILLIFGSLFIIAFNGSTYRWGFYGHKRINRMAVFTLPPELFPLYKKHIEYITDHAPDPDKRRYAVEGEAENHYIDLDRYYNGQGDVFEIVPKQWEDAVAKYTEDTLRAHGILPWNLDKMFVKLMFAFREKNLNKILKYSADIGHYVGDAHVPLHTTKNYNGQFTNQYGIHGFWESRLPELFAEDYDYFAGKATFIKDPLDMAWQAVLESFRLKDTVLMIEAELSNQFPPDKKYSIETRGRTTIKVYSYEFSKAYHEALQGMVEDRMRKSIIRLGSIWYTAWVKAGKPDVEDILRQNLDIKELEEEYRRLQAEYEQGKAKGRVCD